MATRDSNNGPELIAPVLILAVLCPFIVIFGGLGLCALVETLTK